MSDSVARGSDATEERLTVKGTVYRLIPLRGPALGPLVPLLATTYGRRDFTADWLVAKYAGHFGGLDGFSYVAVTEAGEAVASCGMLPWPIRWGDRVEIGVQVVDAATHANHRRRGLFARLASLAHERCAAAGASFFFAFPHLGGQSYPGFVGPLGYRDIGRHDEYRRSVRTVWAERVAKRTGLVGAYQRQVDRVLTTRTAKDALLENSFVGEGFAGTARDAAFYAYKSFGGSRVVHLEGGRVWLKVRHGIQVGDFEAESDMDIGRTTDALERLAARLGLHQVIAHSAPGTRLARFLATRWARTPSVSVVYRDIRSRIPPECLRFSLGDLDNF